LIDVKRFYAERKEKEMWKNKYMEASETLIDFNKKFLEQHEYSGNVDKKEIEPPQPEPNQIDSVCIIVNQFQSIK
jgi:hypothetical protein